MLSYHSIAGVVQTKPLASCSLACSTALGSVAARGWARVEKDNHSVMADSLYSSSERIYSEGLGTWSNQSVVLVCSKRHAPK